MATRSIDPPPPTTAPPPETASLAYGAAVLAGNGDEAERIALFELASGMSVAVLYEEVLAPAMVKIGELWAAGEMTVADEHLATALNLKVMSAVYAVALPSRPRATAGRVLLAGVAGDPHAVGIRMAGDVIELAGFELDYLGADVALDTLLGAVVSSRPDAIAIGVPSDAALAAAGTVLASLAHHFPRLPVLIGGGATTGHESAVFAGAVPLGGLAGALRSAVGEPQAREVGEELPEEERPPRPSGPADASAEDRMLEVAADAAEAARAYARAGDEYRRLAFEDPLTGVANRRALEDRIEELISSGAPASLLMMDLDGFKSINDRLGHLAGDRVLRRVARLLTSLAGEGEFVARLGGDEFAVLVEGDADDRAQAWAEGLLRGLRDLGEVEGVTATCGISRLDGDRRAALIEADLALYRGKATGGDVVG